MERRSDHGPGAPQGYHLAALNGAVGTLMALWHREATGQGQHVEVSMQAARDECHGYGALYCRGYLLLAERACYEGRGHGAA